MPGRRFRTQIALVFGGVVLLLDLGLSIALGLTLSDTIRTNAGHALQAVADNAQRELAEGLHRQLLIVEGLAGSADLWRDGLASPAVETALAQQQRTREHLAWIGVADERGIVRAASGGLLVGGDVHTRPWFVAGLQAVHVGDVHEALMLTKLLPPGHLGEPQRFVDFAAPVRVDGRAVGVLAVHGSWDWAQGVIETLLPGNAAAVAMDLHVVDRSGTVIYAAKDARPDAIKVGDRLDAALTLPTGSAAVLRWPDHRDYLTSVARLAPKEAQADLGWRVVARVPKEIAYAPVHVAVTRVAAAGVGAAVVALILAWVVTGRFSGPLAAIARAAQDLRRGKVGATMPTYGGYIELEQLSTALAEMTDTLESRVKDRTLQLEQANGELARTARSDSLTGMLNRRGFDEQLAIAVAGARRRRTPLSVIAIDVDHFKKINDNFGHAVGDTVLTQLAALMKSWFRESDIIARLGGEEFTILLPDTGLAGAHEAADGLVALVAETRFDPVGRTTISCGVSEIAVTDAGASALDRADRALYAAKAAGRNRVIAEAETPADGA